MTMMNTSLQTLFVVKHFHWPMKRWAAILKHDLDCSTCLHQKFQPKLNARFDYNFVEAKQEYQTNWIYVYICEYLKEKDFWINAEIYVNLVWSNLKPVIEIAIHKNSWWDSEIQVDSFYKKGSFIFLGYFHCSVQNNK